MTDTDEYEPPRVWTWEAESGGAWAGINRPVAGPTHARALPVGKHPLQLYSLATPNGQKVTILLEELLALGEDGAPQTPTVAARRFDTTAAARRPCHSPLRAGDMASDLMVSAPAMDSIKKLWLAGCRRNFRSTRRFKTGVTNRAVTA